MISQIMHNVMIGSLVASILAIFLIVFRQRLIQHVGAVWHYYLWFSVTLSWFSIWLPFDLLNASTVSVKTIIMPFNAMALGSFHPVDKVIPTLLLIIWLSGIGITLLALFVNHCQYSAKMTKTSRCLMPDESVAVARVLTSDDHHYLSRIYLSQSVLSPMICHLFNTKILLPITFFDNYTAIEQSYILRHECVHLKRRDLVANTVMLIVCAFNWFNPILFYAYRYFRHAQELACDAVISQCFSGKEKQAYGYALLKTVIQQNHPLPAMSCGWNSQRQLKERCQMLKFHQAKPIKTILGAGLLIAVMCTAIAAPNIKKGSFQSANTTIMFSANRIQPLSNQQQTRLEGDVNLSINDNITIRANHVLVNYVKDTQQVTYLVIYGKGTLQEAGRTLQFVNGSFNPNNSQLTAETIQRMA